MTSKLAYLGLLVAIGITTVTLSSYLGFLKVGDEFIGILNESLMLPGYYVKLYEAESFRLLMGSIQVKATTTGADIVTESVFYVLSSVKLPYEFLVTQGYPELAKHYGYFSLTLVNSAEGVMRGIDALTLYTNQRLAVVVTNSMEPELVRGDLVYIEPVGERQIKVGDIIAFNVPVRYRLDPYNYPPVMIHRVIDVIEKDGVTVFKTKGDNIPFKDPFEVALHDVIGVLRVKVPLMGSFVLFLKSEWGMVYIMVAAISLGTYTYISKKYTRPDLMPYLLLLIRDLRNKVKGNDEKLARLVELLHASQQTLTKQAPSNKSR